MSVLLNINGDVISENLNFEEINISNSLNPNWGE
jgi:hypothetical protein